MNLSHQLSFIFRHLLLLALPSLLLSCMGSPAEVPESCMAEEIEEESDCILGEPDHHPELETIYKLKIETLSDLEEVCNEPCSRAHDIELFNLKEFDEFAGLDFITHAHRVLISSSSITEFSALQNLEVLGSISIDAPNLETIAPFAHVETLDGGVYLKLVQNLRDLTAFSNVRRIGDGALIGIFTAPLEITDAHSLVDLKGLENAEFINHLSLLYNDNLESLNGLDSLTEMAGMRLQGNPKLASLQGLENVKILRNGASFLDNPKLRRCEIEAFLDGLEIAPEPDSVRITNASDEPCND